MVLQTTAMTTSAKAAKIFGVSNEDRTHTEGITIPNATTTS